MQKICVFSATGARISEAENRIKLNTTSAINWNKIKIILTYAKSMSANLRFDLRFFTETVIFIKYLIISCI